MQFIRISTIFALRIGFPKNSQESSEYAPETYKYESTLKLIELIGLILIPIAVCLAVSEAGKMQINNWILSGFIRRATDSSYTAVPSYSQEPFEAGGMI